MNDAFIASILEFAFFAAFAHWRLGLSVSSTITPKSRWWFTRLRNFPFSWYWGLLFFDCWGCSLGRHTYLHGSSWGPPGTRLTGPRTEPCGTPLVTSINLEYPSPTLTRSVLLVRKLCIQLWSLPAIPSWSNFCSNLRWGRQSKAFLKSKYITLTPDFLSKAQVHCSWELSRFDRHDLLCLKPCCLVLIICFESTNRVRATLIIRSITFKHVLVRLTGRKFFGSTRRLYVGCQPIFW